MHLSLESVVHRRSFLLVDKVLLLTVIALVMEMLLLLLLLLLLECQRLGRVVQLSSPLPGRLDVLVDLVPDHRHIVGRHPVEHGRWTDGARKCPRAHV